MKLLSMQSSPASRHLPSLRSKRSAQRPYNVDVSGPYQGSPNNRNWRNWPHYV